MQQLDVTAAPRNSKVLRSKNSADVRSERQSKGQQQCNMFADEFQAVFNMVQADKVLPDSFVHYVIATGHCVPSVILYTERQICEIKALFLSVQMVVCSALTKLLILVPCTLQYAFTRIWRYTDDAQATA